MTTPDDELVSGEGVNEGSARSTDESLAQHDTDNDGSGVTGSLSAASQDGVPADEYDPAPPVETGLPGSTTPADRTGPGQQLEAGEG